MEAVVTEKDHPITTGKVPTAFKLSAGQKGLYIVQKLHPEAGAYNVPLCFKIDGPLNLDMLAKAWACVLEQFPILTAKITENEGELYHHLDDACKTQIQRRPMNFANDQDLVSFVRKRAMEPFDLNRGPLTRIELLVQDNRKSVLLLTVHHIVFDGISAVILTRALFEFYRQLLEKKMILPSQDGAGYHEFVAGEEAMLASARGAAAAGYWRQQLAGELPVIELPSDRMRAASASLEAKTLIEDVQDDLAHWVRDFARAHSLRPSVIFLAVFQLLLHRYTDQDDIIVGMAVSTRMAQHFAASIGYFVNMIPIRTLLTNQLTFSDLLRRVQGTMMDGLSHSGYPFPLMLEQLNVKQIRSNPVFQVTYAYHDYVKAATFAPLWHMLNLNVEGVKEIVQEGEPDLGVEIFEQEMSFTLHLKYNPEIYSEHTAQRILRHYLTFLQEIRNNPDRLVHEYTIVSEQERCRLLIDYNATQADYPQDKCLHQLFAEQVALKKDKTAVVYANERLTYEQLYERSQDLALYLQSIGVKPDSLVGLCAEKSVDMIVGLLGILQAGGVYLPLDPTFPDSRLTHMLEDSQAAIILTQQKLRDRLTMLRRESTRLVMLDQQSEEISGQITGLKTKGVTLRSEVKSHHLAYVMYTSGSTGRPKGVMIEHKSAVNHNVYARKQFQITPQDIQVQFWSSSTDAFIEEVFVILNSGAQLVLEDKNRLLTPQYFEDLINTHHISTINIPTALFHKLIASDVDLNGIKNLIVGGEELAHLGARAFVGGRPGVNLYNTYGPTETTIISTAVRVSEGLLDRYDFVPIGTPIANTQIYILDRYRNLQPVGVPGELHIAGDGLARGYLNRPELTRERFVANPFQPGTRMYKTGDLARWLPDGSIQYLGRVDTQIKIRGFRVEPGEVEAQLNRHPAIRESAIVAQGHAGEKRLVAFYKPKSKRVESIPFQELREHLSQTLPDYMVPAAFVSVAEIPLTPNGKVDRRALTRMDVEMESSRKYVAPRNDTERQLAGIWAQVLNLAPEKIGIHDDFFELGGHSLLATQVIAKVRSQLGVELPLNALFERNSVGQIAGLVAKAQKSQVPPIRPADRTTLERLPLSFAQERLWFIHQLWPDSPAYNLAGTITLDGELGVSQLEQAFNLIIARHENLRTVFPSEEGQARQLVLDRLDFRLERIDLSHDHGREERTLRAKEVCQADTRRPFDLARGPLIRGKRITLAPHEHILMVNMHHIITDGWSMGIMIKELDLILDALKKGREPALAPLSIQYADFSVWQRRWQEKSGVLEEQLAYWQKKLAGAPETLQLATDYPHPDVPSFAGERYTFMMHARLTKQLNRLGKQHGSTLFMVLLAAFKCLIYRETGQSDICLGSPIANRQYGETAGLIGMFVNTLALRTQVESEDTFSALLKKVRATCLEAYEHQGAPFERVVDVLHPQRNLAMNPIFQVMFALQNADPEPKADQRIQPCPLHSGISKFDLTVDFTETPEGLAGAIEFRTELYKPQTIERMAAHFTSLCQAITAQPGTRVCDLDYVDDEEKQRVLVGFNDTRVDYPRDKCLHELLVEQVALHSGKTAVISGDEQLTYQQLYEKSQDLALYLQSLGVKPDSLVGLCMERSLDMVVGLLGILQAGGAYVPLDPDYPEERLAYMLQDSQTGIVLTQEKLQGKLNALMAADTLLVTVDRQRSDIGDHVAELKAKKIRLEQTVKSHHLAYVIYTSGSTGTPKGVMVEHGNVVRLFLATNGWFQFNENDVWTLFHSYAFDFSVWEIWGALAYGGCLVVVPKNIARSPQEFYGLVCRSKITVLNQTPSAFRQLITAQAESKELHQLRYVIFGGETLETATLKPWYEQNPQQLTQLINMYGITETTVHVTYRPLQRADAERRGASPIGRPIPDLRTYILDWQGQPVPVGVGGELYVGGAGVARGYLNREELTAERFVRDPFTARSGSRMYKTGDLGRWLPDGTIEFLGRNDDQVKIRGFRIELGEIEARLRENAGVREAVVVVREEGGGGKRLVAYYTSADRSEGSKERVGAAQLRAQLSGKLPDYMVPGAYVRLDYLPLTANGKLDRKALPEPEDDAYAVRGYEAPVGPTETIVAGIWAELLKVERVGRQDNFFELGGHSLLATQLISKIRRRLDIHLPLKAIFKRPSLAQLAESIATAAKNEVPAIRPVDRTQCDRLALGFAQERLWFLNQLEPGSIAYNLPLAATLAGELDMDQLEQAFHSMIARHESLRTVFSSQEGQGQQRILDQLDFKLGRTDLSHYGSREERDRQAREICRTEGATPFDLERGPLLRGKVIKVAEQEHILMLNMHHIISDGWSLGILSKELVEMLEALQQGRSAELKPLPIQYLDYAVWQRRWLEESGTLKRQLGYWQEKLAGVAESLDLATDYPRPKVQSSAGAMQEFTLDGQLAGQLKLLAEEQGSTLFMVLLAACKVMLYRYTGQNDLCVGSPIANRQYGETEGLIGMFVNTLALRSHVEGGDRFTELLAKVKATCLEAYENQDAPFEKIVELLQPVRNLAMSPVFQVMVVMQGADLGAPDEKIQLYPVEMGVSKFDLTIGFLEGPKGLRGVIEYSTALYKGETIERMVEHFVGLCRAIVAQPAARIQELEYVGEGEKERVLVEFNNTRVDYPWDKCIHDFFLEQVVQNPGAKAVVFGNEQLTYQQLYERSRDLAMYLQSLGVKPEVRVALCMERSLDMMVGLFAILQAGGAYVPLDPAYPEQRLAYMLSDSGARLVVTQERLAERLRTWLEPETPLLVVDRQRDEIENAVAGLKARDVELQKEVRPHHLAYVIYTSGSTGEPKGVAIEHHSPVTLVRWASQVYSGAELAGVLASTSICFDLSVYEIFVTLANGGTVVLVANALGLVDIAKKHTVTLVNTVPSAMEELVRLGAIPDTVQTINLAGEALSPKLVDAIYQSSAVKKVYDLYGPSEATTYSTYLLRMRQGIQSIGRPIANTQIYILDEQQQVQPIGVPGELYIAGEGLARGYLNRAELTRQKFVANRFAPGTRMYRTGDRARWLEDGNIQYLGRMDTQVKIRGFRIELGEIEARLNQHPDIEDSVVMTRGEESNKQLMAFYRARETQADHIVELGQEGLRGHLLRTLPDYMVPAGFVSLAAIPLNANGKVDRRALAQIDVAMKASREYVAPNNNTERQLIEIWAQVLNLAPEKIGYHDNFFELGGHSLSALRLMAKISKTFEHGLPPTAIFTAPNIAELAEMVAAQERATADILVPIHTGGNATPIFGVPGAGGNVFALQPLVTALGPDQPFYGLQAVGLDGNTLPLKSLEETAKANIRAMKTLQPAGPYRFIGHCYGGVVAYEMTSMLASQGEEVSSLILLESFAPAVKQAQPHKDENTDLFEVSMTFLRLYDSTLGIDLEHIRCSSNTEKIQYIVALLNDRGLEITVEQFVAFYGVYRANLLCYDTYRPSRLSGRTDVSLYRATQEGDISMPRDYGWNQLLPSPARIYDVEANHFTILKEVRFQ